MIFKEWTLVEVESLVNPSPRKGSCMAAIDDFILIFGGITESGYTNELWMFDYGSNSYKLLTSKDNNPDKLAFSRCQASYNANNQIIFEVYTGETSDEIPVSSIYEYNYSTQKWSTHRENSAKIMIKNFFQEKRFS